MTRIDAFLSTRKALALLYLAFRAIYLGASGPRLRHHSANNHYVYLAEGWLDGRTTLAAPPPHENDWGKVDVLTLRDGRVVRGMFRHGSERFLHTDGRSESIPAEEILRRDHERMVTFPPLPAVFMLPFVAFAGLRFNDVLFTVVWAAMNPVLLFLLLRRLARRGHSRRRPTEDLLVTAALGVGSVYFYAAVVGQVWYTAHVIGLTFVILYAWAALDAARPALAGLAIALGFACRPSIGFMFPFFLCEAARASGGFRAVLRSIWRERRLPDGLLRRLIAFALPAAAVLAVLLVHNYVRFDRFGEFGHKYLNISWQPRMQRWGELNYHFLSRNLACALVLLPRILTSYPFVKVSVHGMSLLVTSPTLAWTVFAKERSPLAPALWLTVLSTALPGLLYHNSGYVQWGYRFSLDYMTFLLMLVAVGGRPIRKLFVVALVFSVGINLLGALTFDRHPEFTYNDSFFPHGVD
jgi:hypothetical protein